MTPIDGIFYLKEITDRWYSVGCMYVIYPFFPLTKYFHFQRWTGWLTKGWRNKRHHQYPCRDLYYKYGELIRNVEPYPEWELCWFGVSWTPAPSPGSSHQNPRLDYRAWNYHVTMNEKDRFRDWGSRGIENSHRVLYARGTTFHGLHFPPVRDSSNLSWNFRHGRNSNTPIEHSVKKPYPVDKSHGAFQ